MKNGITKAQQSVLKAGSSTAVFVAAICASIMAFTSLIGIFVDANSNFALSLLKEMGVDLSGFVILVGLIGLIPIALETAGLWCIWANAKKEKTSTIGYTLNLVTIILQLIGTAILTIILVIVFFAVIAGTSFASSTVSNSMDSLSYGMGAGAAGGMIGQFGGALAAVIAVFLIICILMVLWNIKLLITALGIQNIVKTGQTNKKISQYAIVFNYIVASFSIIGTIVGMVANFGLSFISNVASIVLMFAVTVTLGKLKKELNQPGMDAPVAAQSTTGMGYQDEDSVTVPMGAYTNQQKAVGAIEGVAGMYDGASIPVESGTELIIGRDEATANLVIKNPKVSRKHCGVRYNSFDGTYTVTDYSSNGLFYKNGQEFPKNTPVTCKAGTIFVIAQSGNEFRLS